MKSQKEIVYHQWIDPPEKGNFRKMAIMVKETIRPNFLTRIFYYLIMFKSPPIEYNHSLVVIDYFAFAQEIISDRRMIFNSYRNLSDFLDQLWIYYHKVVIKERKNVPIQG